LRGLALRRNARQLVLDQQQAAIPVLQYEELFDYSLHWTIHRPMTLAARQGQVNCGCARMKYFWRKTAESAMLGCEFNAEI
jgi:hypothetical protein